MTGTEIARRAREQLAILTGLEAGTLSRLIREDDGWHVSVDLIELKRVPDTTDVLATYEAVLDDNGNLLSHQRLRRYLRAQVTDGHEAQ